MLETHSVGGQEPENVKTPTWRFQMRSAGFLGYFDRNSPKIALLPSKEAYFGENTQKYGRSHLKAPG